MNKLFTVQVTLVFLTSLMYQTISAQADGKTETKPDYRNHINGNPSLRDIPEYDPSLMPLNYNNRSTGVWTELNPKVPRVDYYSVYFKDDLSGFAVGEFGAIIKTTDGGKSWIDKTFPTQKTLLRISGSENFIIITGTSGTVLRSTNFGESWDSVNLGTNADIWGVYTLNDSISLICSKDGKIYRTTNSGIEWTKDSTGITLVHWDLQFMNTDTGFISCGDGVILKTTDGGKNWLQKNTGDNSGLYSIEILPNRKIITAGSSGKIYYSTDYGDTFIQSTSIANFVVEDIGFANNEIGFTTGAASLGNAINRTTDGGLNWLPIEMMVGNLNIDFVTDSIGYSVGADFSAFKSTDVGGNWDRIIINKKLLSLSIPSDSITYFLTIVDLFKFSTNKIINIQTPNKYWGGVYFLTPQVGYLTQIYGEIFKTSNGGDDWDKTDSNSTLSSILDIKFVNPLLGWYLCSTFLKRTIDGGNSWEQIFTGSNFNSFYFLDSLNGWIAANGKTYRSSDGGENWNIIDSSSWFHGIEFRNLNVGYATNGMLYKTIDGGLSWQLVSGATGDYLQLVDSTMLVTWKTDGTVFISMDDGFTWNEFSLPNINFLKFYNRHHGYVVGDNGLIYSYTDTTTVNIDTEELTIDKSENTLFQNYPNPFNSSTKIFFDIPYIGEIELRIYNILAEQKEKKIYKILKSGVNQINYIPENLNSGVYFYKIVYNQEVLIGKMLYIK